MVECMIGHLRDTFNNHSILDVPLNVQDLSPKQWQSHLPTGPNATLAQFLSSSQQIILQL